MKLALALSGGGFRATVFHLGVLARLAVDEQDLFPQVTFLSTVSGGSLCAGLIYALSDFKWPRAQHYLNTVVPQARRLLTTFDLQRTILWDALSQIWALFQPRTHALSRLMRQHWGVTARLADIPSEPRWLINACCHETGKNFRFEPHRMGDYILGYAHPGNLPLSDALAASAGFPGLIGYLPLRTGQSKWFRYIDRVEDELFQPITQARKTEPTRPKFPIIHLWDGGVYDNQGVEGLMDFDKGWRKNIDFLLISDASPKHEPIQYRWGIALYRLITGIMMEQVRSLRARAVLEQMQYHQQGGSYVRIGNSCPSVLQGAKREQDIPLLAGRCMKEEEIEPVARMETHIRKMTTDEFEQLFRHGYETADYTLYAFHAEPTAQPVQFKFMGYAALRG